MEKSVERIFEAIKRPMVPFLVGSAISIAGLLTYQHFSKHRKIESWKAEIVVDWDKELKPQLEDDSIMTEQLSRNIAFLGEDGVTVLKNAFVIVIGLGGVGSHAAHMLVRAGAQHVRLIDFDQVTLSSLNRHAVATRNDVGIPKVTAMKNHLLQIVPRANIETRVEMFEIKKAAELLGGQPDFVLDCIDHLQTKVELMQYCVDNGLKIISSMGAGAKADPSRIQIGDLSTTFEDSLARACRQQLKRIGRKINLPVVYSTEKPSEKLSLIPLDESKLEEADQYAALPTFRSRILPVLGTIPALFGNAMASFVITELSNFEIEPLSVKTTYKNNQKLFKEHCRNEIALYGEDHQVLLDSEDLGFIYEDTWRSRSALSGTVNQKLVLIRWNSEKDAYFGNMILLTKKESDEHKELKPSELESKYGLDFVEKVQQRFQRESRILKLRNM